MGPNPTILTIFMLTNEEIEEKKTDYGGWTRKQLEEWGIPWPPPKGWKNSLKCGDVAHLDQS